MEVTVLLLLIIITGIIVLQVKAEQRWRQKNHGQSVINEKDHYCFPGIYYNRSDKRIFVSKRSGGGYTLNVGSPIGLILLILIISSIYYLITM
jgi:uncharacterized membrane protein